MIQDKPFQFSEMLRKTTFLSRPNFFNAIDLNKELDTIHNFMEEFNKVFAVSTDIKFTFATMGETENNAVQPATVTRTFQLSWNEAYVLYKGVKITVPSAGKGFEHVFNKPDPNTLPKQVSPPSYLVLTADLAVLNYSDDPELCGLTSTDTPLSVPSVEVEQYKNVQINLSTDLEESNILCILGTVHPIYKTNGESDGFGFLMNTFYNDYMILSNGLGNEPMVMKSNGTLFEYIIEQIISKYKNLLNERQLVRRFDLADLSDPNKARHNLGLSKLVNHRQLVQAENLRDIPDVAMARQNLGLGNASTLSFGATQNSIARGDIISIGVIVMWYGDPTNLPAGWFECNGSDGTPDLRKRFPVGYHKDDQAYFMGQSGGADSVTLTSEESGTSAHTHTINDPGHDHDYVKPSKGRGFKTASDDNPLVNILVEKTSKETTGITVAQSTGESAKEAHENRPPFRVVMFIMYKGIEYPEVEELEPELQLVYPNFSTPTNSTSDNYSSYNYTTTPTNMGAGVILTN